MSGDRGDIVMEMSGAGSASLLRVLAEAGTDLLLRLDVRIIVNRTVENSDAHTSKSTETQKFLIDGWSRIEPRDLAQLMEKGETSCLLRFRRHHQNLYPSYQDRRIMKMLQSRNERSVFILVNNEATNCFGIKTRMTGFLIGKDAGGLVSRVKIKVPCLGAKSEYIQSQPSSGVRESLVQGMRRGGNIWSDSNSVVRSFEKVSENFHKNVDVVVKEVLELENERDNLKKKILQTKNKILETKTPKKWTKMYDFDNITQQFLDNFLSDREADVNLNTIYRTDSNVGGVVSEVEGVRDNTGGNDSEDADV